MSSQTIEERDALLGICKRAGIPPEDIIDHPQHGLMVSAAAVHKLRAIAPSSHRNSQIGKMVTELARSAIRRVK